MLVPMAAAAEAAIRKSASALDTIFIVRTGRAARLLAFMNPHVFIDIR
jgi:hypothetical protein